MLKTRFSTEFPTPMKVNKTGKNNKMVYISFSKNKLNLKEFQEVYDYIKSKINK